MPLNPIGLSASPCREVRPPCSCLAPSGERQVMPDVQLTSHLLRQAMQALAAPCLGEAAPAQTAAVQPASLPRG